MRRQFVLCVGLLSLAVGVDLDQNAIAQEAVGWRTDGSGVYPDATPSTKWSKRENVVWAAKMPGRSNSQPVISGDRLFVCAEPFALVCVRLTDGKVLWKRNNSYRDVVTDLAGWSAIEKELAVSQGIELRFTGIKDKLAALEKKLKAGGADQKQIQAEIDALNERADKLQAELDELKLAAKFTLPKTQETYNGFTTATPTCDGQRVYAVFGNRVVVCYDMNGKRMWSDVLPDNPQSMWGHSSSPLLVGDKLIVNIDATVAFDKKTGKQLWRTRYGQCWGSAVRARIGGEAVILLANGRYIRAADGKVVARVPTLSRASAIVHNQTAYYIDERAAAFAFPAKLADRIELEELWTAEPKGGEFSASPVIHDGLVYGVTSSQILNVIDAKTGKSVYVKRLSLGAGPVWPSLCIAGDKLFVSSRDGTTLVLATGREYREIARNTLDYFISNPVFHRNRMYVRTNQFVYCIGES